MIVGEIVVVCLKKLSMCDKILRRFIKMNGCILILIIVKVRFAMSVSYDKLSRLMKDNKMTKHVLVKG